MRLREANALLKQGLFDSAYYLAGYAVECALKACIAKGTQRGEFPDRKKVESSHSHNLRDLIRVAGLDEARLERLEQAGKDPDFGTNWDVVYSWSEQQPVPEAPSGNSATAVGPIRSLRNSGGFSGRPGASKGCGLAAR